MVRISSTRVAVEVNQQIREPSPGGNAVLVDEESLLHQALTFSKLSAIKGVPILNADDPG